VRHGFKTWAEKEAAAQRQALGLRDVAALSAVDLAAYLGIAVVGPEAIPGMTPELLHQLLVVDAASWSAVTVAYDGCTVIIHNTAHAPCRQESNVMHELAHGLCGHPLARVVQLPGVPFPMREYDADHEEEASWLGACLQLPRVALLSSLRQGLGDADIMEQYNASDELVRWRRRLTGVDLQLARRRRRGW
jgi:hypothetical protein